MAKVISLFKISGTIGDLTFRETASGTVAQKKPGPTREQVLTHSRFDCTRRNAGEFKRAIKDSTLLRHALGWAINGVRHSMLNSMMNALLKSVSNQDKHSDWGYRHAGAGDVSLLTGFDFNPDLLLDQVLRIQFRHSLDAATGILQLKLPAFLLRYKKGLPKKATHFRIVSGGVAVDFVKRCCRRDVKVSALLPLGKRTPGTMCLEHQLKAAPGEVLVQVLGIEFYEVMNGREKLLKFGAMRILEATHIDGVLRALPDTEAGEEERKPFTAKDLQE